MVGISNRHADQECGAIGASNFARDACDRMGAWMGTAPCSPTAPCRNNMQMQWVRDEESGSLAGEEEHN